MQKLPTVPIPIPHRIYYGWVIVATSLIINVAIAPLNPVIFSFFITPISEEMGWSLGAVSLGLTCRLLFGGITAPLIGLVIDRFGPRFVGVIAGLVAGSSVIGLFYTKDLWLFYLLFAISGGVGLGGGPGGNLLTMVPVAKWFVSKRGRAMSVAQLGVAVGAVLAIPASQWMIQNLGWREAWVVLGIILAITTVPMSFLFLRGSPSDLGMQPDGFQRTQSNPHPADKNDSLYESNWTAREALRHPVSWLMLVAFAVSGFALTGTLVHRVAYWEDIGMVPGLVAFGTAMDPLIFIFSVLIFGFIGERVRSRYLGVFGGLVFSISMFPMLLSTGQAYTILAHSIIWATAGGAYITANNLMWPNYFGRQSLGAIRGIVFPIQVAATGFGPPVYGYLLDIGLNPTALWTFSATLFTISGILLWFAKKP